MSERKYKKPLKNCEDCKRLCFVVNEREEKEYYCGAFHVFKNTCDRKKEKGR